MLLNADIARAICCEGQPCMRPEACDAGKEHRVPVNPRKAAKAVHRLLCEAWRDYPRGNGPMTRTRTLEAQDE